MSTLLIFALGATTYVSRALGLAFTPRTQGRVEAILQRLPAPLFAALAVVALVGENGAPISSRAVVAAACALAVSWTRSLPLVFAAGVAGYLIASL